MNLINVTKRCLLALVVVSLFLLVTHFYYTQHFLSRAVSTNALVVAVTDQSLIKTATLRFITENKTVLESNAPLVSKVNAGGQLPVLYNQLIPSQTRINNFYEIWYSVLIYASLSIALIILFVALNFVCNLRQNKIKKLKRAGDHIYTQFKAVEADLKVEKDGRHPYRIISTWLDPKTKKQYEFKSDHLWKNPNDYIMDQTIKVLINAKNKRKYLMDLSFLPDNIIKN